MHETVTKRIYVGGLASDISSEEIYERFARFGKVSNLSIKTRTDEQGNKLKSFAHLDLEGDEANIKKCFSTYQNAKWKGSVLQLQYAKESFLKKLEKEREEAHNNQEAIPEVKPSTYTQKSQPELFEVKGPAVPGTPVPGKKDWIVGKYGRALPVLKLKKSYKIKMVKHDPSKHCHAAKVFKDDKLNMPSETSCDKLTWEINTPDSEITKKRKGQFPDVSGSSKKLKGDFHSQSDSFRNYLQSLNKREIESLEIVKSGSGNSNLTTNLNKSNRFDSDIESGSEDDSFVQNAIAAPQAGKNLSDKLKPENKSSNKVNLSRPVNKSGEKTRSEPAIKNTNVKPVLKTANKNNDIIKLLATNKNSDKKATLKLTSTASEITASEPTNKNIEIKSAPKISANKSSESNSASKISANKSSESNSALNISDDNSEQSTHSDKKDSAVGKIEFTVLGSHRKIPEFKGLEMLSSLTRCSSTVQAKSEQVTGTQLNSSMGKKSLSVSTSDVNTEAGGNSDKRVSLHSLSSPRKHSAAPELRAVNRISHVPDVRKNSSARATASPSTANSDERSSKENLNQFSKKPLVPAQKLSLEESKKSPPSVLSNDLADSLMEESVSKNYDSSSSANTDEIIARCKKRKGLSSAAKSLIEKSLVNSNISTETGKHPLQTQSGLIEVARTSFVDHSLGLSEFTSGISESSSQSPSREDLVKHNDTNDSYDSDLDSNDFELVAKKLAQKAMSSETEITGKKKLGDLTKDKRTLNVGQDLSKTGHQNKKDKVALVPVGGQAVKDIPAKSMSSAQSKSSAKDSTDARKRAADNEKRLQAVRENMKLKQLQQSINQQALKNVDFQGGSFGKRVVFSSSEDDASDGDETSKNNERFGLELFDSEDDDEEEEDYGEMFKSKPHFEGKKGEKLMKLDQKIGDPRFKLDAKFALSDSEDEADRQHKKPSAEMDKNLEDEKSANMKILENVIGKTALDRFSEKIKRNTKHIIDMNAVRFDPTKVQNKTEAVSVGNKKNVQGKTTIKVTPDHSDRKSETMAKMKEEQKTQKINEKAKGQKN